MKIINWITYKIVEAFQNETAAALIMFGGLVLIIVIGLLCR